jgi:ferritin-like metal-binding protein YciE
MPSLPGPARLRGASIGIVCAATSSPETVNKRILTAWLNDAHAMEARSLTVLRRAAADSRQRVEVRVRLESHVRETVQHAQRLQQALDVLGSSPAPLERHADPVMVLASDITARVFSDPLMGKVIAAVAAKQFEVAAYTALIAAAEHAGEAEVARLCRLNRGEDEEMAEWLEAQIWIVLGEKVAGTFPAKVPATF